jgi:predicted nucleic acid-binding protein
MGRRSHEPAMAFRSRQDRTPFRFCPQGPEGELSEATLQTALECFQEDLRSRFHIVRFTEDIIDQAISVLLEYGKRRPLRTLDALQIASAKAVESPGLTFVTADRQLFTAASELFLHTLNPGVESENRWAT